MSDEKNDRLNDLTSFLEATTQAILSFSRMTLATAAPEPQQTTDARPKPKGE